jgi:ATP-dependent Clp protease ATP-binding subunit ClpA
MKTSIYTHATLQLIQQAQERAREYKHTQLMPEHILFELLDEDQELVHAIFQKVTISI